LDPRFEGKIFDCIALLKKLFIMMGGGTRSRFTVVSGGVSAVWVWRIYSNVEITQLGCQYQTTTTTTTTTTNNYYYLILLIGPNIFIVKETSSSQN
jgi:hypothetical protein